MFCLTIIHQRFIISGHHHSHRSRQFFIQTVLIHTNTKKQSWMGKIFLLLFMQVQFFSIWSTYFFGYFPYFPGFIIKISFVCFELYWGEKTWNFLNFIHLSMILLLVNNSVCVCVWLHAFFFSRCFFFKKGHRLAHHLSFVNYIHTHLLVFSDWPYTRVISFLFFWKLRKKAWNQPYARCQVCVCMFDWPQSFFFIFFSTNVFTAGGPPPYIHTGNMVKSFFFLSFKCFFRYRLIERNEIDLSVRMEFRLF